jgi:small-conductance mechanosensitive channel
MRPVVLARLVAGFLVAAMLGAGGLRAQPAAEPTPEQVRSLLQLLADPVVKSWIARELERPVVEQPAAERKSVETEVATFFEAGLAALKVRVETLAAAVPGLPHELAGAQARVSADLESAGWLRVLLLTAAFVGFGYGCQWVFWLATASLRERIMASPLDTPAARGRAVLARLLYGLSWVLTFALGSIGAFLVFAWPASLRAVVLGYLLAFLALRVGLVLARFLFAPQQPRFRVVPMSDAQGSLWYHALIAFVGWYAFGFVTIQLLRRFAVGEPAVLIMAYLLGLGLLGIVLRLIWRSDITTAARFAATGAVALIYLAWIAGAKPTMWALIVALLLPVALWAGKRSVEHLFRQEPTAGSDKAQAVVPQPTAAVLVDRAVRFLLLVGGLGLLAWGWGIDYGALTNQDDPLARFARGALHAVIILLVADLLWQLASTAIDRRIASTGSAEGHDPEAAADLPPEEERRRARLRTLLPVLRITLLAVLAVMAVLMALSALGVQIGPLIAGAGVIGVAIGFGSQTLVRDIISGMFYLLDDAFRVGEYIVSGTFRGTVEGFSLRSIRLRHHRGPLFTVPFGNLGAVQNLSRDWVIDKITFNVPFDTDVAKVKKIVKWVSAEIMEDPALAKGILEPLKSQGVFAMNDFAMQIRVKFKARPGGQFAVRRAAYDRIKRALAENGIKMAVPTVSVAGGEGAAGAAAAQLAAIAPQRAAAK